MDIVEVTPTTELITGEALLAMGDMGRCELIDGGIVKMSPVDGEHGFIEFNIGVALKNFVQPRKLGWVLGGEVGVYIRRNPDRIRGAGVAFMSKKKLDVPPRGFLEVAPESVMEIISPSDRWQEIREKIVDYFSIGVEQVWIIEPASQTVLVYRSNTDIQEFKKGDVLVGEGVLDAFKLPVNEIFELE